jgi:hypothetical protein
LVLVEHGSRLGSEGEVCPSVMGGVAGEAFRCGVLGCEEMGVGAERLAAEDQQAAGRPNGG